MTAIHSCMRTARKVAAATMSNMAGPIWNMIVPSSVWTDTVPRSMIRSSSPVLRWRWKLWSSLSTCANISMLSRLYASCEIGIQRNCRRLDSRPTVPPPVPPWNSEQTR